MKKIFFLGLMALCFLSAKAQYGTYSVQNQSNLQNEKMSQLLLEGLRNGTTTLDVVYAEDDHNSQSVKPKEIDTTRMVEILTQIFDEEGAAGELVKNVPATVMISNTSIIIHDKDLKPINTYRILEVRQNGEKNGWDFLCENGVKITMNRLQSSLGAPEVATTPIPETQKVYRLHLPDGTNLNIKLFD